MTFFSTADRLEIGGVPFVVAGDKPTRREALRYFQRLAREFHLDVHQYETVTEANGALGDFIVRTRLRSGEERSYRCRHLAIATGYFDSPNLLGIPGERLANVAHEYQEGHVYYDQDVVVVGGGNSAVDAALELYRWGARVTIVHFLPELDGNVKPWVRPDIDARIREGSIAARMNARLAEIRPDSVIVEHQAGEREVLPNDWVLAMTGYTPDGRLLRGLGVAFDDHTGIPRFDSRTMETNVPGVFIAGVIAAGYDANKVFIENGRDHGALIVAALTGRRNWRRAGLPDSKLQGVPAALPAR